MCPRPSISPTLTSEQDRLARAFLERMAHGLAEGWKLFLGRSSNASIAQISVEDSVGLRMGLPQTAYGVSLQLHGCDRRLVALCTPRLARTLVHLAYMGSEDVLPALRAEATPLNDNEDQEAFQVAMEFLAQAFGAQWDGNREVEESEKGLSPLRLEGALWQGAEDPFADEPYLAIDIEVVLDTLDADVIRIFLPWSMATGFNAGLGAEPGLDGPPVELPKPETAISAPRAEPPPAAAVPTSPRASLPAAKKAPQEAEPPIPNLSAGVAELPLFFVGSNRVLKQLKSHRYRQELYELSDVKTLTALLARGAIPAAIVIQVSRGGESDIGVLGRALRMLEQAPPVLLLLDYPVRSTVLQCAKAGVRLVLPSDCPSDLIRRRLLPKISGEYATR